MLDLHENEVVGRKRLDYISIWTDLQKRFVLTWRQLRKWIISFHEFNVICARCHVRSYFPELCFVLTPSHALEYKLLVLSAARRETWVTYYWSLCASLSVDKFNSSEKTTCEHFLHVSLAEKIYYYSLGSRGRHRWDGRDLQKHYLSTLCQYNDYQENGNNILKHEKCFSLSGPQTA